MGVYNLYGGLVQLKCGFPGMMHYELGETTHLEEGVYIGYEGVVVIDKDCKLLTVVPWTKVYDAWGAPMDLRDALDARNPVVSAIHGLRSG